MNGQLKRRRKTTDECVASAVGPQLKVLSASESGLLTECPPGHEPAANWTGTFRCLCEVEMANGVLVGLRFGPAVGAAKESEAIQCPVCGWHHDTGFTQIRIADHEVLTLSGVLPEIVAKVHRAHEKGFPLLSTKDEELVEICGGYYNPCKAFDSLKWRREYKLLFNTRRRGFIALRGVVGRNWNKTESGLE